MLPPETLAVCALALCIEALIGYPAMLFRAIGHPVTWIGAAIAWGDARLNRPEVTPARRRLAGGAGLAALLATVGGLALLLLAIAMLLPAVPALVLQAVLASTCLAQRSLYEHVAAVADALEQPDLMQARAAVGMIVGRDTRTLDPPAIARAAIESLAENFADGIVAPALWIAVFGLPGGILYKAVNTADSMIAHRTPRHAAFGFCAAKVDDLVNWPAARLAAVWLVIAAALTPGASVGNAWRIARRDSGGHASPNAGWPEAAMAGALGLRLGGVRTYDGRLVEDAGIGDGTNPLHAEAVRAALALYRVACGLQIATSVLLAIIALSR